VNVRRFVRRSIELRKKLLLILAAVSLTTGAAAVLLRGESTVYRAVAEYEPRPYVNIYTAGMPLVVSEWDGEYIRIEVVSELPLIVELCDDGLEITISQDDGFAVSIFTLDMFRYRLLVQLPRDYPFKEVNTRDGQR
jgi:hypothetical protein